MPRYFVFCAGAPRPVKFGERVQRPRLCRLAAGDDWRPLLPDGRAENPSKQRSKTSRNL